MKKNILPWREPLKYLSALPEMESCCLLYSGLIGEGFGRYSLLALWPQQTIQGDDWKEFEKALSHDKAQFENAWFGYLGYGLKNKLEHLPTDTPSTRFHLPELWMTRYHLVACFDHYAKTLQVYASNPSYIEKFQAIVPEPFPVITPRKLAKSLASNMQKSEYSDKVNEVLEAIASGEVYQANLTRKFHGKWSHAIAPEALFNALCTHSPAPYSAFLKCGDTYVLSSSPEMFLNISADGKVTTKPIKGSAPRSRNIKEDKAIREELATSEKNRAENLMIVDLMRNDLSRSCVVDSIKVESLHDITSYLTVHHMSSTITGKRRPDAATLDVVKSAFPPGSMTGAPKIKAMELCTALERDARGIYSGAIGWFGGDGSAHLSVVIRTLLLNEEGFEFQVGGGIVADSTPESEWQETLIKARGIAAALDIREKALAAL